jgi:hypothetical protein
MTTPTFNWWNTAYDQTAATSATLSAGSNAIGSSDFLLAICVALSYSTDPGAITPPSSWSEITAGTIGGNEYDANTGFIPRLPVVQSPAVTPFPGPILMFIRGRFLIVNSSSPFDNGAETLFDGS